MAYTHDQGARDLARLSRQLKAAGDKGLQKELTKSITQALKPLRRVALPKSALTTLPRHGHINVLVSKTKYRVSRRTGASTAGLRLTAGNIYDLLRIDQGYLRHPVFKRKGEEARRVVWKTQRVTPGWFTGPTRDAAPEIQAEIKSAMERIVAQIQKGL